MRPETRRQIRQAVLYDMAPARAGQVSLEEVGRVFRGRGELRDFEDCMDEFVKEGVAKKTTLSGESYYLFESIAREAVTKNDRRLREIEDERRTLEADLERIETLVKEEEIATSRLRPIWLNGWEKSKLSPTEIVRIQSYLDAFLDRHLATHRKETGRVSARILALDGEKTRRLRWKEDTFVTVSGS